MSMTRSVKTARNAQLMKQVKKHVPFYFFLLPALVLVVVLLFSYVGYSHCIQGL